jgi:DNA-binding PadR family transcriptional regulator
MGNDTPRITAPALKVLGQLMNAPLTGLAGADISKTAHIPSGTLYPILFRLEKAKWLCSEWEEADPAELGRPRKRLYRLTPFGSAASKAAIQDVIPENGRLVWQS